MQIKYHKDGFAHAYKSQFFITLAFFCATKMRKTICLPLIDFTHIEVRIAYTVFAEKFQSSFKIQCVVAGYRWWPMNRAINFYSAIGIPFLGYPNIILVQKCHRYVHLIRPLTRAKFIRHGKHIMKVYIIMIRIGLPLSG